MEATVAGRAFGEVYRVSGRTDLHMFLEQAVEASGGRVLYASDSHHAPVYLGVQLGTDEHRHAHLPLPRQEAGYQGQADRRISRSASIRLGDELGA